MQRKAEIKAEYDRKVDAADISESNNEDNESKNVKEYALTLYSAIYKHIQLSTSSCNYYWFLYIDPAHVYHDEYLEQLAEINDEDPPEVEEDEEEESEVEATERMKSTIIEQFEEQIESLSLLQVKHLDRYLPMYELMYVHIAGFLCV